MSEPPPSQTPPQGPRGLALLVGIATYQETRLRLQSPVNDVARLREALEELHGFDVDTVIDGQATKARLRQILTEELPERCRDRRLLIYFAGHGVALDSLRGVRGYLVPVEGSVDPDTLLSMDEVAQAIGKLPCRQLLLVLDCCFAGTVRWSASREFGPARSPTMYLERYAYLLGHRAWQALTSSAHDELAYDVVGQPLGDRTTSPFLDALIAGLEGGADGNPSDGVITATDLYAHISRSLPRGQTAGLWPLEQHDKGEFVFRTPGRELTLPNAVDLAQVESPYRGFEIYERRHADLLFGRDRELHDLILHIGKRAFSVVVGRSGVGKSSLVRAGLLPALERQGRHLLDVIRPGRMPMRTLDAVVGADDSAAAPGAVLIVDQLEELYTQVTDAKQAERFLARLLALSGRGVTVVATLRLDLEAQFWQGPLKDVWDTGRFALGEMTPAQLRAVIERPADEYMLLFEPAGLVDDLVGAVVAMPGGLPLLSFMLSEMYREMLARGAADRTLRTSRGGVAGVLQRRLDGIHDTLDAAQQQALKFALLRLVTARGGAYARRQVPTWEFDEEHDAATKEVLSRLTEARLVVPGPDAEATLEAAHDAVVGGWSQLKTWLTEKEALDDLALHRQLTDATGSSGDSRALWTWDPRRRKAQRRLAGGRLNLREARFLDRSTRSRTGWLAGITVATLIIVVSAGYALWQNRQRKIARAESAVQAKNAQFATGLRLHGDGVAALLEHDASSAFALLAHALTLRDSPDTRARILEARASVPSAYWHDRPGGGVVALSPLTARAAVVFRPSAQEAMPPGDPCRKDRYALVWVWDIAQRRYVQMLPRPSSGVAAFSPDGARFAYSGTAGDVWLIDAAGRERLLAPQPIGCKPVRRLVFGAAGTLLAAAREDGTVTVYDLASGERTDFKENASLIGLALSPDGERVAAGGSNYTFTIRERRTGRSLGEGSHRDTVQSLAFDSSGTRVATGGADGVLKLWRVPQVTLDCEKERAEGEPKPPECDLEPYQTVTVGHSINDVLFDPRVPRIAMACEDGIVRLWDEQANQTTLAMRGQGDGFFRLAYSADGSRLFAGAIEHSLGVWELREHGGRFIFRSPVAADEGGELYGVFSPDSKRLITASSSGAIRGWTLDPPGGGEVLRASPNEVYTVAAGTGGWLATAGSEHDGGSVFLWNESAPGEVRQIPHLKETNGLGFDRSGTLLVSGGRDYRARLWDVATGAPRGEIPLTGSVWNAAISSTDRSLIAIGDGDRVTSLWRVGTGDPINLWRFAESGEVWGIAFSDDGRLLASGGVSKRVHVWELGDLTRTPPLSLHERRRFELHTGTITSIAFGPDDDWVLSGGMDTQVFLGRISTGASVALRDHTMPVWWVAMSRDGRYLASGGLDTLIAVWERSAIRAVMFDLTPAALVTEQQALTGVSVVDGAPVLCSRCGTIDWSRR